MDEKSKEGLRATLDICGALPDKTVALKTNLAVKAMYVSQVVLGGLEGASDALNGLPFNGGNFASPSAALTSSEIISAVQGATVGINAYKEMKESTNYTTASVSFGIYNTLYGAFFSFAANRIAYTVSYYGVVAAKHVDPLLKSLQNYL